MFLADTLSKAPLPEVGPPKNWARPEKEYVCRVNLEQVNAAEFLRLSDDGLRSIQHQTEIDSKLLLSFFSSVFDFSFLHFFCWKSECTDYLW